MVVDEGDNSTMFKDKKYKEVDDIQNFFTIHRYRGRACNDCSETSKQYLNYNEMILINYIASIRAESDYFKLIIFQSHTNLHDGI